MLNNLEHSRCSGMMMMMELLEHVCTGIVECERFLKQPHDAVVSRGQSHVLDCVIEDRVGEVQWLRDGLRLRTRRRVGRISALLHTAQRPNW